MGMDTPRGNSTSRYTRIQHSDTPASQASWEDADPDELWRTITAIVNAGDAVTLSRTTDGGALSLTILSGTERIRKYARGEQEIRDLLADIRTALEATD